MRLRPLVKLLVVVCSPEAYWLSLSAAQVAVVGTFAVVAHPALARALVAPLRDSECQEQHREP